MANVTSFTRGDSYLEIPGRIVASFTLDGANDPSDPLGNITAVRRLVTAGATIFFRVTLKNAGQLPAPQQCQATALPSTEAQHLVCNVREDLTAAPADAKGANEIDVTVFDAGAGVPATVDTAGIQVRLGMDARV